MLSRLVRVVNVSIAILAVLIAALVYWYAIRPLPKTSGVINAPIRAEAAIKRDARGVPHIEASSWQDAIFLQGLATAQDRLWQMDSLRRFGSGTLAEVFGPPAIIPDIRSRTMRMRAIAESYVPKLSPEDRALFEEYARGVNYFIDNHQGDFSLEFSLPGHQYTPNRWTIADSFVIGLVMFRDLTDTSETELKKGEALAQSPNPARFHLLFPAVQGQQESPGSNSWAVSGAHTEDGSPMLANDPHLGYGIPPTWHMVHLKAPGLNVSGVTLPGIPGVISGHNNQIAWGVTNMQTDVMDLYSEQLDTKTGQYVFDGHAEQAKLDRETIRVRGAKPLQIDIWVTRHGPIVLQANGKSYSMRWTATEQFAFPFFKLDQAQNWDEFRRALSLFIGPGQNFTYADRAGNIGYQSTGLIPIRKDFEGDVPLDGASGKFEWRGYIPFDQLPSIYNPPSGIVVTANQNPFTPNFPYFVEGSFADRYREQQIRNLLHAKSKLNVDDMLAIQKDVYSAYDFFLAQQAVVAFDHKGSNDALVRDAISQLRNWNGQMDKNAAAPAITELLNAQLGLSLAPSAGKKKIADLRPRPQIIEALFRQRPSGWVQKDDWDGWILENLAAALKIGRTREGGRIGSWHWGQLLRWNIAHPVGKQLPFVNRFFDIGPVEMSGAGTSVKQTTLELGPSERMVVDLGDLDKSVQNLTTGESGFVASGHYKDQWPAYYTGKSFPMQFNRVDAKDVLRVLPAK